MQQKQEVSRLDERHWKRKRTSARPRFKPASIQQVREPSSRSEIRAVEQKHCHISLESWQSNNKIGLKQPCAPSLNRTPASKDFTSNDASSDRSVGPRVRTGTLFSPFSKLPEISHTRGGHDNFFASTTKSTAKTAYCCRVSTKRFDDTTNCVSVRRIDFAVGALLIATLAGLIQGQTSGSGGGGSSASGGVGVVLQSDPRPTIYSGQVSFALLLSAHSSPGNGGGGELSIAATTQQVQRALQHVTESQGSMAATTNIPILVTKPIEMRLANQSLDLLDLQVDSSDISSDEVGDESSAPLRRPQRQIFERTSRRQQPAAAAAVLSAAQAKRQAAAARKLAEPTSCSQINPSSLFAGMGAVWASHQANLVADSQLQIGTYLYDSCNDLDVGQRQSVRIVSNLNAFQQTTCEAPRGSPISLTISHGDNQLRAIQLLTSFKVPVITTKEPFALEDYSHLSAEQRRFLFSTAPSSRHLAAGALKFGKLVVSRSTLSPKLPNYSNRQSSKNGLIVISRNLPAKFIAHLSELVLKLNYEILHSNQPIDQVRSVEVLESILNKNQAKSSGNSESSRAKRESDSGDSSDSDTGNDQAGETRSDRMLSPTIMMFITPAEAIDLITRLRNDLAEVSKYYSLVVSTREDISPALRTIFHRGGSRLCSGKAFYTISPRPDDINEFSRYFRDTVQMEGEGSDHPLVCEFARYQAASKMNADFDEVSTESVIKAVWSAAAAFKYVHKRECGQSNSASSESLGETSTSSSTTASSNKYGRQSTTSAKSAQNECLTKMHKGMSGFVQRALRRLDVNINSTGLQSLDGFRIKFDEFNELQTNKFSIKYVNKECEISEIGQFSGLKYSALQLDSDLLAKSLETALPDPWPIPSPVAQAPTAYAKSPALSVTTPSSDSSSTNLAAGGDDSSSDSGTQSDTSATPSDDNPNSLSRQRSASGDEDDASAGSASDGEKTPAGSAEVLAEAEPPKKKGFGAKPAAATHKKRLGHNSSRIRAQVIATTSNGRGMTPGIADGGESRIQTTTSSLSRPLKIPAAETTPSNEDTFTTLKPKTMRKLKPFSGNLAGAKLNDWLPKSTEPSSATTTPASSAKSILLEKSERDAADGMGARSATELPTYSHATLPESGGNTDLDMPAIKTSSAKVPITTSTPAPIKMLDTAATTELPSSEYVTMPTLGRQVTAERSITTQSARLTYPHRSTEQAPILALDSSHRHFHANSTHRPPIELDGQAKLNYLRDLNSAPVPLSPTTSPRILASESDHHSGRIGSDGSSTIGASGLTKLRSQFKWIQNSWFAFTILGANICGALLTLYVLTFLLLKNCDGSLDRQNQGIRSMQLLAIIIVFFGSTLFIVYPTPGLCLLRTSWHNFALALLFGSLLLQAMQTRSMDSIGIGGRPNRLNQFLTLVFMVGVQVSFELQRWRYESANYISFVNQYLGSSENSDKNLVMLTSALAQQFNPLNSFNDQLTPVSIQVSEKYQSLLHDYCTQSTEDFLQSQIYLWLIIGLLIIFSLATRNSIPQRISSSAASVPSPSSSSKNHRKLGATLTSGKILASEHEANLNINSSQYCFKSNVPSIASLQGVAQESHAFLVTLICALIYSGSVLLHIYGHSFANYDLVSSLTMVLIAFVTLIGIFLPIIGQVHRCNNMISSSSNALTVAASELVPPGASSGNYARRNLLDPHTGKWHQASGNGVGSTTSNRSSSAFAMFPEFSPTGLRRPSSVSGESGSGAGSRRPFAETKESRRNMGVALANLGPSVDSLRNMGLYSDNSNQHQHHLHHQHSHKDRKTIHSIDPASLNLKLNMNIADEEAMSSGNCGDVHDLYSARQHHQSTSRKPSSNGEKRLIMLDVDPCCPRHGISTRARNSASCMDELAACGSRPK